MIINYKFGVDHWRTVVLVRAWKNRNIFRFDGKSFRVINCKKVGSAIETQLEIIKE